MFLCIWRNGRVERINAGGSDPEQSVRRSCKFWQEPLKYHCNNRSTDYRLTVASFAKQRLCPLLCFLSLRRTSWGWVFGFAVENSALCRSRGKSDIPTPCFAVILRDPIFILSTFYNVLFFFCCCCCCCWSRATPASKLNKSFFCYSDFMQRLFI